MVVYRSTLILIAALLGGALLQGCATRPTPKAPAFAWGQHVDFRDFSFNVVSVTATPSYKNWIGNVTRAGDNFVIVEVNMINRTDAPVSPALQPVFRLIDKSGAVYEPSNLHTMAINMSQRGRLPIASNMNPKVLYAKELVFEVPRQAYLLQAIVPDRASVGFAGNVTSSGPYFTVDLSTQL